jgi:ABC-type glycerol-3-phosphate transport system substrate-binding protein
MKRLAVLTAALALAACGEMPGYKSDAQIQAENTALIAEFEQACDKFAARGSDEHVNCMWQEAYAWRQGRLDAMQQREAMFGAGMQMLQQAQPRPAPVAPMPWPQSTSCRWYGQTLSCM